MDFHLPADTGLGSVSLTTNDLAGLEPFYVQGLGFQVLEREPHFLALGVEGESPILNLVEEVDARPAPDRSAGLYHFAVLLPDRRALAGTLRQLMEQNIRLDGAADHLVSEALYLSDPQGNGIELYADRPSDTWRSADGQLKMATLPLDADGLLALKQIPASQLPAGTRLGHIHLHVSHLGDAVHFYERVLGFELMMRYGPSAAFLSSGGYHHHIGLNTWQGEGAPPPPVNAIGLRDFSVILREAEAWAELRRRLDAPENGDPARFSAVDPSGHAISFEAGWV
jgi:catechol 2,3-dioxygenase